MNARSLTRLVRIWMTVAFALAIMILARQPLEVQETGARDSNTPSWNAEARDAFPHCRKHHEGDVAGTLVVVMYNGTMGRIATDDAYELNNDGERANNVWVIGNCGKVTRG